METAGHSAYKSGRYYNEVMDLPLFGEANVAAVVLDMGLFLGGWLLAQALFDGYERHEPWSKRLTKMAVMFVVLLVVRLVIGRAAYYGLLLVASVGIAILHGYWFHYRHGIHWRTAEPRDKYLALIGDAPQDGD